jgi:hypothetical protein
MTLAIGDLRFTVDDDGNFTPKGIKWDVKIGSARKVDKKTGEKEDDAQTTDKGREARDVKITFSWADTEAANALADPIVEKLDPSNPKPGNPPDFAYERNGMDIAKRKNVRAIKIEKAQGPDADDAGKVTYEITASSFTAKPKASPGAGTPKTTQKFVEVGATVQNFGGIPGNTVTLPPGTTTQKPEAPKP